MKIFIIHAALLFIIVGCTEDCLTKTVGVGGDVTLTCSRRTDKLKAGILFWMKLVPGNLPEVLGSTYTFSHGFINKIPRVTVSHGPGTFVLHLSQTRLTDSAIYYCEDVIELQRTILNVTFIRIKGPEPETTPMIPEFPPVKVHPGDSVTLQCSVLSEDQTCPDSYWVYWFRAESNETHPSVMQLFGNVENCGRRPEIQSPQKCVYNTSMSKISPSDAGTYYCAVVTCGGMLTGNGTQLDIEASLPLNDSFGTSTLISLLFVSLATSLIVIVLLVCKIKKLKRSINAAADSEAAAVQPSQPINEDALVYSVPNFRRKKTGQRVRRGENSDEGQSIYADVRA